MGKGKGSPRFLLRHLSKAETPRSKPDHWKRRRMTGQGTSYGVQQGALGLLLPMFSLKVHADVAVWVVVRQMCVKCLWRSGCYFLAVEMEIEVPIHPEGYLL